MLKCNLAIYLYRQRSYHCSAYRSSKAADANLPLWL